jgi:hypothetical protein
MVAIRALIIVASSKFMVKPIRHAACVIMPAYNHIKHRAE